MDQQRSPDRGLRALTTTTTNDSNNILSSDKIYNSWKPQFLNSLTCKHFSTGFKTLPSFLCPCFSSPLPQSLWSPHPPAALSSMHLFTRMTFLIIFSMVCLSVCPREPPSFLSAWSFSHPRTHTRARHAVTSSFCTIGCSAYVSVTEPPIVRKDNHRLALTHGLFSEWIRFYELSLRLNYRGGFLTKLEDYHFIQLFPTFARNC